MALQMNVGGQWVEPDTVYVKVNGVWVPAKSLHVKQDGVWMSAWQNVVVYVNDTNLSNASIFELMGSPTKKGRFIFENNAEIYSVGTDYALTTGPFPEGSELTIVNKGYIRGRGGNGGGHNEAGEDGGNALKLECDCIIDNTEGFIYGGGGGGGGGYLNYRLNTSYYIRAGGGGGAGYNFGVGAITQSRPVVSNVGTSQPSDGTKTSGGYGGFALIATEPHYYVYGGAGGSCGNPGSSGRIDMNGTMYTGEAFPGGAGGKAIELNGYEASIIGGNTASRILGAIS